MHRNGNDLKRKKNVNMLTLFWISSCIFKHKNTVAEFPEYKKPLQLKRVPNNTNKSLHPKGVIQYGAPGRFGLVRLVPYLKTVVTLAESQPATWSNPIHTRQKTFLNLCQLTAHPGKMSIVLLPSPIAAFLRG